MGPVPGTSAAGQADGLAVAAVNAANYTCAVTLGLTAEGCRRLAARGSMREQTCWGGCAAAGVIKLKPKQQKTS